MFATLLLALSFAALLPAHELTDALQTTSRDVCPPAVAITRTGIEYFTSNIQPVIWRVDATTRKVERIELEVDTHAMRDFGFTALAVHDDGRLHALASTDGALWELDPATRQARRIGEGNPAHCSSARMPR
jgi:hypothetical protein